MKRPDTEPLPPEVTSPDDTIDVEDPAEHPDDGALEPESLGGELPWTDERREPIRIVFAGGKGGTGRSLLAANVALFLSRLGRDVVVADVDSAGANLHTFLGLEPLLPNPGAQLRAPGRPRVDRLAGTNLVLCRPPHSIGLGPADPLRLATLQAADSQGADVIVLDMGAQADPLTLDTFLAADVGVVVVVPEPLSIERSYAFLRAALYRRLLHGDDEPAVVARALLAADQVGQLDTPADLVDALAGVHANAAQAIRARVLAFSPKVLINRCRTRADRDMGPGIVSAVRRRWGINAEALGSVENDDAAWEATRRRRALMLEYPGSAVGSDIERLARRLLAAAGGREVHRP